MLRSFASTLLPLVLLLATTALSAEPTELQGTWTEILSERPQNGKKAPREPLTLEVDGASFLEKTENRMVRQSLFRIVPDGSGSIDFMTVVDGEFWLTRAIYKVEGDVLTVCEAGLNEKRPTMFQRWESSADRLTSFLPPCVSIAAFGFGMVMRLRGIGLVSDAGDLVGAAEPLQFTLRRLLMWVTTAAILLAIARGLRSTASLHVEREIAYTFSVLGVMSLVTAGIALATLWATLRIVRPVQRLPFAMLLAVVGGLAPAYCFERPSPWGLRGVGDRRGDAFGDCSGDLAGSTAVRFPTRDYDGRQI